MFEWLAMHPDVGTPEIKEPFYLRDVDYLGETTGGRRIPSYADDGMEGYVDLFRPAAGAALRFEATTHYFYQRLAPRVLFGLETKPKVLVMVRRPSDRFHSWYSFNRNHLASIDPDIEFAEVVDAVLSGRSERLRRHCRQESTYRSFRDGVEHGEYARYLRAWDEFRRAGRLRVEVLEEVSGNERQTVQSIAEWVGIDAKFYEDADFERAATRYRTRFPRAHHVARTVATRLRGGGIVRRALVHAYRKLQVDRGSRGRLSESDRAALTRLDDHYEPANEQLAEALGRPELLELWRREP